MEQEKVVLTNLAGQILICTRAEAEKIMMKQARELLDNGFVREKEKVNP